MPTKVTIGTCGFGMARTQYEQSFSCVEVQQTFYQPPQISTLKRWRQDSAPGFEFTLKAWQLITHEARSPTYRRLRKELSETERADAGFFKPTSIVREAWAVTRACAEALKARTILFQCPASFTQTRENTANLERFFSTITRGKFNFCWEPRGDWDQDIIKTICADLKLTHVVDPLVARSVTPRKIYYRLHGRSGWRCEYEEAELRELAAMVSERGRSYVFFNNSTMTRDALRFQTIIEQGSE